jgi:hypothetical protein
MVVALGPWFRIADGDSSPAHADSSCEREMKSGLAAAPGSPCEWEMESRLTAVPDSATEWPGGLASSWGAVGRRG